MRRPPIQGFKPKTMYSNYNIPGSKPGEDIVCMSSSIFLFVCQLVDTDIKMLARRKTKGLFVPFVYLTFVEPYLFRRPDGVIGGVNGKTEWKTMRPNVSPGHRLSVTR